jgi:ankyrin repeat protein
MKFSGFHGLVLLFSLFSFMGEGSAMAYTYSLKAQTLAHMVRGIKDPNSLPEELKEQISILSKVETTLSVKNKNFVSLPVILIQTIVSNPVLTEAVIMMAQSVPVIQTKLRTGNLFYYALVLGQSETVKLLLKMGNDPNRVSYLEETDHETPLHVAAESGSYEVVRILLEAGANPNVCNYDFNRNPIETPHMIAERIGNSDLAELLRKFGADPKLVKEQRENEKQFIIAASEGDVEEMARLYDKGIDIDRRQEGETALMQAARNNQAEAVRFLLEKGANVKILKHEDEVSKDAYRIAREHRSLQAAELLMRFARPIDGYID